MSYIKDLLLVLVITFTCYAANAQAPADSTIKHSPLKTVTDEQYNALMSGTDIWGFGKAALLNRYPDPENVMKFKKELQLSPIQEHNIAPVAKELHRKKLEMGLIIIKNERVIDSLFHTHKAVDGVVVYYATRSGAYMGELRNAILQACMLTEKQLSTLQINKFNALLKAN
jgi:hypothetical protein